MFDVDGPFKEQYQDDIRCMCPQHRRKFYLYCTHVAMVMTGDTLSTVIVGGFQSSNDSCQ